MDKKINVIVAFKLDRLTRSVYDVERLMTIVNDNDCDIDCMADEANTTTSNGRMVMRIMTSVSQNEIEKAIEEAEAKGEFNIKIETDGNGEDKQVFINGEDIAKIRSNAMKNAQIQIQRMKPEIRQQLSKSRDLVRKEMLRAREEMEKARPEMERARREMELSKPDMEKAKAEMEKARAEMLKAKEEMIKAKAELEKAKADLKKTSQKS